MNKSMIAVIVVAVAVVAYFIFNGNDDHDHDHSNHSHDHAHIKAKHGGIIIEVGNEAAHLEWVHDHEAGKVTIYVTDGNGEVLKLNSDAIKINVLATNGTKNTQLEAKAINASSEMSSEFSAEDTVLINEHLEGKISIKIKDKKYSSEIPHDHDHDDHDKDGDDHKDHDDHEGHDH